MLTTDPDARPNASALLRHKWIGASKPALMKNGLEDSKARLREFNAKRKLKGAATGSGQHRFARTEKVIMLASRR